MQVGFLFEGNMKILKFLSKTLISQLISLSDYQLQKMLAIFVVVCFFISSVCHDVIAVTAIPVPDATEYKQIFSDFMLPYTYGKITKSHFAGTDRVIINIQDLHCHPQVQKNISNIIEMFYKKYGVTNVYLEGAYGSVSTKWLTENIKNNDDKTEILNKILKAGKLTGAEYYSASSDKTEIIKGLEKKGPYLDNLKRFGDLLDKQEEIQTILKGIEESTAKVKKQYYTKKQYKIEKLAQEYITGKIPPEKYYKLLMKNTEELGIDLMKYENTWTYISLLALQKQLNYKVISNQLQELLANLKGKIPYSAYKMLLDNTKNFKQKDILYIYIIKICRELGFDLIANFSELNKYFTYIELSQKINPLELVKEKERLTMEINTRFSETIAQREVVFLTDFEKYLKDYMSIKITSDDYEYYKENIETYKRLYNKYVDNKVLTLLQPYMEEIDTFYKINTDRNDYFTENIFDGIETDKIENIKEEKKEVNKIIENMGQVKRVDVIVTGGFHSQTVTEILQKQGVSYIVITPNIQGGVGEAEKTYYEIAKEQKEINFQALATLPIALIYTEKEAKPYFIKLLIKSGLDKKIIISYVGQEYQDEIDKISNMTDEAFEKEYGKKDFSLKDVREIKQKVESAKMFESDEDLDSYEKNIKIISKVLNIDNLSSEDVMNIIQDLFGMERQSAFDKIFNILKSDGIIKNDIKNIGNALRTLLQYVDGDITLIEEFEQEAQKAGTELKYVNTGQDKYDLCYETGTGKNKKRIYLQDFAKTSKKENNLNEILSDMQEVTDEIDVEKGKRVEKANAVKFESNEYEQKNKEQQIINKLTLEDVKNYDDLKEYIEKQISISIDDFLDDAIYTEKDIKDVIEDEPNVWLNLAKNFFSVYDNENTYRFFFDIVADMFSEDALKINIGNCVNNLKFLIDNGIIKKYKELKEDRFIDSIVKFLETDEFNFIKEARRTIKTIPDETKIKLLFDVFEKEKKLNNIEKYAKTLIRLIEDKTIEKYESLEVLQNREETNLGDDEDNAEFEYFENKYKDILDNYEQHFKYRSSNNNAYKEFKLKLYDMSNKDIFDNVINLFRIYEYQLPNIYLKMFGRFNNYESREKEFEELFVADNFNLLEKYRDLIYEQVLNGKSIKNFIEALREIDKKINNETTINPYIEKLIEKAFEEIEKIKESKKTEVSEEIEKSKKSEVSEVLEYIEYLSKNLNYEDIIKAVDSRLDKYIFRDIFEKNLADLYTIVSVYKENTGQIDENLFYRFLVKADKSLIEEICKDENKNEIITALLKNNSFLYTYVKNEGLSSSNKANETKIEHIVKMFKKTGNADFLLLKAAELQPNSYVFSKNDKNDTKIDKLLNKCSSENDKKLLLAIFEKNILSLGVVGVYKTLGERVNFEKGYSKTDFKEKFSFSYFDKFIDDLENKESIEELIVSKLNDIGFYWEGDIFKILDEKDIVELFVFGDNYLDKDTNKITIGEDLNSEEIKSFLNLLKITDKKDFVLFKNKSKKELINIIKAAKVIEDSNKKLKEQEKNFVFLTYLINPNNEENLKTKDIIKLITKLQKNDDVQEEDKKFMMNLIEKNLRLKDKNFEEYQFEQFKKRFGDSLPVLYGMFYFSQYLNEDSFKFFYKQILLDDKYGEDDIKNLFYLLNKTEGSFIGINNSLYSFSSIKTQNEHKKQKEQEEIEKIIEFAKKTQKEKEVEFAKIKLKLRIHLSSINSIYKTDLSENEEVKIYNIPCSNIEDFWKNESNDNNNSKQGYKGYVLSPNPENKGYEIIDELCDKLNLQGYKDYYRKYGDKVLIFHEENVLELIEDCKKYNRKIFVFIPKNIKNSTYTTIELNQIREHLEKNPEDAKYFEFIFGVGSVDNTILEQKSAAEKNSGQGEIDSREKVFKPLSLFSPINLQNKLEELNKKEVLNFREKTEKKILSLFSPLINWFAQHENFYVTVIAPIWEEGVFGLGALILSMALGGPFAIPVFLFIRIVVFSLLHTAEEYYSGEVTNRKDILKNLAYRLSGSAILSIPYLIIPGMPFGGYALATGIHGLLNIVSNLSNNKLPKFNLINVNAEVKENNEFNFFDNIKQMRNPLISSLRESLLLIWVTIVDTVEKVYTGNLNNDEFIGKAGKWLLNSNQQYRNISEKQDITDRYINLNIEETISKYMEVNEKDKTLISLQEIETARQNEDKSILHKYSYDSIQKLRKKIEKKNYKKPKEYEGYSYDLQDISNYLLNKLLKEKMEQDLNKVESDTVKYTIGVVIDLILSVVSLFLSTGYASVLLPEQNAINFTSFLLALFGSNVVSNLNQKRSSQTTDTNTEYINQKADIKVSETANADSEYSFLSNIKQMIKPLIRSLEESLVFVPVTIADTAQKVYTGNLNNDEFVGKAGQWFLKNFNKQYKDAVKQQEIGTEVKDNIIDIIKEYSELESIIFLSELCNKKVKDITDSDKEKLEKMKETKWESYTSDGYSFNHLEVIAEVINEEVISENDKERTIGDLVIEKIIKEKYPRFMEKYENINDIFKDYGYPVETVNLLQEIEENRKITENIEKDLRKEEEEEEEDLEKAKKELERVQTKESYEEVKRLGEKVKKLKNDLKKEGLSTYKDEQLQAYGERLKSEIDDEEVFENYSKLKESAEYLLKVIIREQNRRKQKEIEKGLNKVESNTIKYTIGAAAGLILTGLSVFFSLGNLSVLLTENNLITITVALFVSNIMNNLKWKLQYLNSQLTDTEGNEQEIDIDNSDKYQVTDDETANIDTEYSLFGSIKQIIIPFFLSLTQSGFFVSAAIVDTAQKIYTGNLNNDEYVGTLGQIFLNSMPPYRNAIEHQKNIDEQTDDMNKRIKEYKSAKFLQKLFYIENDENRTKTVGEITDYDKEEWEKLKTEEKTKDFLFYDKEYSEDILYALDYVFNNEGTIASNKSIVELVCEKMEENRKNIKDKENDKNGIRYAQFFKSIDSFFKDGKIYAQEGIKSFIKTKMDSDVQINKDECLKLLKELEGKVLSYENEEELQNYRDKLEYGIKEELFENEEEERAVNLMVSIIEEQREKGKQLQKEMEQDLNKVENRTIVYSTMLTVGLLRTGIAMFLISGDASVLLTGVSLAKIFVALIGSNIVNDLKWKRKFSNSQLLGIKSTKKETDIKKTISVKYQNLKLSKPLLFSILSPLAEKYKGNKILGPIFSFLDKKAHLWEEGFRFIPQFISASPTIFFLSQVLFLLLHFGYVTERYQKEKTKNWDIKTFLKITVEEMLPRAILTGVVCLPYIIASVITIIGATFGIPVGTPAKIVAGLAGIYLHKKINEGWGDKIVKKLTKGKYSGKNLQIFGSMSDDEMKAKIAEKLNLDINYGDIDEIFNSLKEKELEFTDENINIEYILLKVKFEGKKNKQNEKRDNLENKLKDEFNNTNKIVKMIKTYSEDEIFMKKFTTMLLNQSLNQSKDDFLHNFCEKFNNIEKEKGKVILYSIKNVDKDKYYIYLSQNYENLDIIYFYLKFKRYKDYEDGKNMNFDEDDMNNYIEEIKNNSGKIRNKIEETKDKLKNKTTEDITNKINTDFEFAIEYAMYNLFEKLKESEMAEDKIYITLACILDREGNEKIKEYFLGDKTKRENMEEDFYETICKENSLSINELKEKIKNTGSNSIWKTIDEMINESKDWNSKDDSVDKMIHGDIQDNVAIRSYLPFAGLISFTLLSKSKDISCEFDYKEMDFYLTGKKEDENDKRLKIYLGSSVIDKETTNSSKAGVLHIYDGHFWLNGNELPSENGSSDSSRYTNQDTAFECMMSAKIIKALITANVDGSDFLKFDNSVENPQWIYKGRILPNNTHILIYFEKDSNGNSIESEIRTAFVVEKIDRSDIEKLINKINLQDNNLNEIKSFLEEKVVGEESLSDSDKEDLLEKINNIESEEQFESAATMAWLDNLLSRVGLGIKIDDKGKFLTRFLRLFLLGEENRLKLRNFIINSFENPIIVLSLVFPSIGKKFVEAHDIKDYDNAEHRAEVIGDKMFYVLGGATNIFEGNAIVRLVKAIRFYFNNRAILATRHNEVNDGKIFSPTNVAIDSVKAVINPVGLANVIVDNSLKDKISKKENIIINGEVSDDLIKTAKENGKEVYKQVIGSKQRGGDVIGAIIIGEKEHLVRLNLTEGKAIFYSHTINLNNVSNIDEKIEELMDEYVKAGVKNADLGDNTVVAFADNSNGQLTINNIADSITHKQTDYVTRPFSEIYSLDDSEKITENNCKGIAASYGTTTFSVSRQQYDNNKTTIESLEKQGYNFIIEGTDSDASIINLTNKQYTNKEDIIKDLNNRRKEMLSKNGNVNVTGYVKLSENELEKLNGINVFETTGLIPLVDAKILSNEINVGKVGVYNIATEEQFEKIKQQSEVVCLIFDKNSEGILNKIKSLVEEVINKINSPQSKFKTGEIKALSEQKYQLNLAEQSIEEAVKNLDNLLTLDVPAFLEYANEETVNNNIKEMIQDNMKLFNSVAQGYIQEQLDKGNYIEALGFVRGVVENSLAEQIVKKLDIKDDFIKEINTNENRAIIILTMQAMLQGKGKTLDELYNTAGEGSFEMTAEQYLNSIRGMLNANLDETLRKNENKIVVPKEGVDFDGIPELLIDNYGSSNVESDIYNSSINEIKALLIAA